jgi:hypothetical protein
MPRYSEKQKKKNYMGRNILKGENRKPKPKKPNLFFITGGSRHPLAS